MNNCAIWSTRWSLQGIGRGLCPRFCSLYKYLAVLRMQNNGGALQTLAALMFSGFLFSLSVKTDPPGLNVLSHATRATDRRGAGDYISRIFKASSWSECRRYCRKALRILRIKRGIIIFCESTLFLTSIPARNFIYLFRKM